jgi:hypothetical protein
MITEAEKGRRFLTKRLQVEFVDNSKTIRGLSGQKLENPSIIITLKKNKTESIRSYRASFKNLGQKYWNETWEENLGQTNRQMDGHRDIYTNRQTGH